MKPMRIGVDLAKNVFQAHGAGAEEPHRDEDAEDDHDDEELDEREALLALETILDLGKHECSPSGW